MTHRFKINQDFYEMNEKIYSKSTVTIKEGLTVLCGCNGSGKTTLLKQIKTELKKKSIPCLSFNNLEDGGSKALSSNIFYGNFDTVCACVTSSEGESITHNFCDFVGKISKFLRNNDVKELFILIDAVDSGLSVDNVIDLKELFNLIIEDNKKDNIPVYIIVSSNEYELVRGSQCLDTPNLKYIEFKDYEDYREYIKETRKMKVERNKWEKWQNADK